MFKEVGYLLEGAGFRGIRISNQYAVPWLCWFLVMLLVFVERLDNSERWGRVAAPHHLTVSGKTLMFFVCGQLYKVWVGRLTLGSE